MEKLHLYIDKWNKSTKGGEKVRSLRINRKIREEQKMEQAELASKLNVDMTTVVKWESGGALPRTSMLPTIAKVLGCKIDDLFISKVE